MHKFGVKENPDCGIAKLLLNNRAVRHALKKLLLIDAKSAF